MPKLSLTEKNIAYIKRNRLKMSGSAMAEKLGVGKGVVTRYMQANGLQVSKRLQKKFRVDALRKRQCGKSVCTPQQDRQIKKLYLVVPVKTLAHQLGIGEGVAARRIKQLGLKIPKRIIEQRKIDSRIKPGNVPPNKGKKQSEYMTPEMIERTKATRFQKGDLPHNTKEKDGTITIRHEHPGRNSPEGRPYKYIRVSLGKWVPLHTHLWEKKHGKVPAGHCLWFKDGNSLNCKLKNLELITRAENARRNKKKFLALPEPLKQTIHLLNKIKKNSKKSWERQLMKSRTSWHSSWTGSLIRKRI